MLGMDHQQGRFGSGEPGADPGVFGGEQGGSIRGGAACGCLRLGGADASAARVRRSESGGQGFGAEIHRTDDRIEPGAGDAADRGAPWKCRSVDSGGKPPSLARGALRTGFPPLPTALGKRSRVFYIPTAPPALLFSSSKPTKGPPAPIPPYCPRSGSSFDEKMLVAQCRERAREG